MKCPCKDVVRIFLSRVVDSLHYSLKNKKPTIPLVIDKLKIAFKCTVQKIYEKIELSLDN